MFTKTLIAAAALSVLAGIGAASANPYSSNNYVYDNGNYGHWTVKAVVTPRQSCEKVYEIKTWHDYYGWHTANVFIGEKCQTVYDTSYVKVWVASY